MLGERLRKLRMERGMTCQELADAIKTTHLAIEQYEANRWRPGTPTLAKIAGVLHMRVDEILEDCSLVKDQASEDIIILQKTGDKQVRIVGTIKAESENPK